MNYKITKEQYGKIVDGLIKVFFSNLTFDRYYPDPDDENDSDRTEIYSSGNNVGWIIHKGSSMITKGCKYELVIYTETILKMKLLAPLLRKKLFAKTLINFFSEKSGLPIDCLWIDEEGDHDDDKAFKYKIKKKKK